MYVDYNQFPNWPWPLYGYCSVWVCHILWPTPWFVSHQLNEHSPQTDENPDEN